MNVDFVLPPHDEEAEQAVLGCLLIDPNAIPMVASALKPEDFYIVKNQWIYQAEVALGQKLDTMTLSRRLSESGQWGEVGEESYVAQLQTSFVSALNVHAYADQVKRMSVKRKIIQAAQIMAKSAYDASVDTGTLVDSSQTALIEAVSDVVVQRQMTLAEAADKFFTEWNEMLDTGIVPGIQTGIKTLDYMMGGMKRSRLTVVGALPGMGKTTIMLNILLHAAKQGHRVFFFSLEMREDELLESLTACESGIDLSPQTMLKLPPASISAARRDVGNALARILKLPLHILYAPSASPSDLIYQVKALNAIYRDSPVELAAFDYIQLGKPDSIAKNANREQEVSAVALGLKQAAGVLNIHVLSGTQVNEQGDARESKAITQHADTVIYLTKDESAATPNPMVTIGLNANFWKNRKGPTGDSSLMFNKANARITGRADGNI